MELPCLASSSAFKESYPGTFVALPSAVVGTLGTEPEAFHKPSFVVASVAAPFALHLIS